jgi:hypothetical protein
MTTRARDNGTYDGRMARTQGITLPQVVTYDGLPGVCGRCALASRQAS